MNEKNEKVGAMTVEDLQKLGILPKNESPVKEAEVIEEAEVVEEAVTTESPVPTPAVAPQPPENTVSPQQQIYDRHVKRSAHAQSIFSDLLRGRMKNATKSKDLTVLVNTAFDLADAFQAKLDDDYRKDLMEYQWKSVKGPNMPPNTESKEHDVS